jgi:hypothetical protein
MPVFSASDAQLVDLDVQGDLRQTGLGKTAKITVASFDGEVAPAQKTMDDKVILKDDEYIRPDNLSRVASVQRDEADALLSLNPAGVKEYFTRKGCGDLGELLSNEDISGVLLSSMNSKHLEKLQLTLGQRLTLEGFLTRFRAAARAKAHNEALWSSLAQVQGLAKVGESCCFGLMPKLQCNCCQKKPVEYLMLPAGSYTLTQTALRISDYEWADETPTRLRQRIFKPNCQCGVLFGWYALEDPPYIVKGNNIHLSNITDVDFVTSNIQPEKYRPTIWERLLGWSRHLKGSPPAIVAVSYKKDDIEIQTSLSLDPSVAKGVSDKILSTKDEAALLLMSGGREL